MCSSNQVFSSCKREYDPCDDGFGCRAREPAAPGAQCTVHLRLVLHLRRLEASWLCVWPLCTLHEEQINVVHRVASWLAHFTWILDHPPVLTETPNMNSIGKDCNDLKRSYEECFNSWFSDQFLRGQRHDACSILFKEYQSCVKKAIQEKKIDLWELDRNVLNTEQEKKPPEAR